MRAPDPAAGAPAAASTASSNEHGSGPLAVALEPKPVDATIEIIGNIAVARWSRPLGFFFQGIAGGACVMFGVMLAIAVSAGISSPGLANLVSGLVFGFSFLVILVSGASLITSDMAAGFIALCRRKMTLSGYVGFLAVGWVANVVGAFIFIGIIAQGPGSYAYAPFLAESHAMAVSKASQSPASIICMGIICTWLLQIGSCCTSKRAPMSAR